MKELVLKIKWGHLGDHLLYSPIPRVAKQMFEYDKVFISNHSDYFYSDTKKFVWERNPFVDGFSDKDFPAPIWGWVEDGMNILDKLLIHCGLPDDGMRFREPEIYYTPKLIPELQNAILFDPNYNSVRHPSAESIMKYLKDNNIRITHQIRHRVVKPHIQNSIIKIEPKNVEDFCNVLYSCKQIFCLVTGTATLSAALGKVAIVFYSNQSLSMARHSKLHLYKELT